MPNKLAHFAIEADDVDRAKRFYESVFGWQFEPWGPPDFYLIAGAGLHGSLQERTQPLPEGRKGFEISIAVDDLAAAKRAVTGANGVVVEPQYRIPHVGELVRFVDTEGNEAILIQYEPERARELGLARTDEGGANRS